ncbi:tetratricopeptide repeat protein [Lentzea sp. NBRC 102530]|uniref:tetratricopeptide repeat protein n=1 Tax=Lentzea sp. NBRC 102530 TaxID=3032201 RepID=UPI002555AB64|nr:tetratricopeptide repeat protein [Lentzea sp. NBRC 102530]
MTEELLTDQSRALGAEHPHTLRTRYNLAHWTGAAGDPEAQRAALVTLLEDQVRILGPDHPDTGLTRQALAGGG